MKSFLLQKLGDSLILCENTIGRKKYFCIQIPPYANSISLVVSLINNCVTTEIDFLLFLPILSANQKTKTLYKFVDILPIMWYTAFKKM